MDTKRDGGVRRWLVVTAAIGGLAACGTGAEVATEAASPVNRAAPPAYGTMLAALDRVKVPTCPPAEGGGFIALPAPAAEAAQGRSWFRYLEGRIYEFGPCQLAPGKRNELRIYLYPDVAARDTALRDIGQRGTRPTSTFAYQDLVAIEIWSPEPSLESPVGQLAQAVHSAIGATPQARHLDLVVGA